mmetsp:Transcript_809/g.2626  ORF Transcript_809/g.2626 Transcript_809/m.2626 type:complete len:1091 (+) Transcript_809:273-3545(+)
MGSSTRREGSTAGDEEAESPKWIHETFLDRASSTMKELPPYQARRGTIGSTKLDESLRSHRSGDRANGEHPDSGPFYSPNEIISSDDPLCERVQEDGEEPTAEEPSAKEDLLSWMHEDDYADSSRGKSISSIMKWLFTLLRLAWKHCNRHRTMFALGVCTLLLLVFMMTLLMGVMAFAPGIITYLVETDVGQNDLIISNGGSADGNVNQFLNYTTASGLWDAVDFSTHTSRLFFRAIARGPRGFPRGIRGFAFDTVREEEIHLGPWSHPPISDFSCYLSVGAAQTLEVQQGDNLTVEFRVGNVLRSVTGRDVPVQEMAVDLTVAAIIYDFERKFPSSPALQVHIMVEMDFLEKFIRGQKYIETSPDARQALQALVLREYSTHLYLQLPPPRAEYLNPDFKVVRNNVLDRMRRPIYEVDFRQLNTEMPILSALGQFDFLSLFLGLLVNVALAVFLVLAWVILYSLFSYSVDTRNYEVGVLRVVGMGKVGIVELVCAQVLLVSLPSWSLGLVAAQAVYTAAVLIVRSVLGSSSDVLLPGNAIAVGTLLGLLVPALAAVLPLRRAIQYSPSEAFSRSQNRSSNTSSVKIQRENARIPPGVLLVCVIAVVLGFILYYLFPLALISLNITLLLFVFMILLVSMLLGLCLLFMNFDRILMSVAFYVVFWWESPVVKKLVRTNFVGHRSRNRKTFLMYNLTIALVIYLDVMARSQIKYLRANYEKNSGAEFAISAIGGENFKCCREEMEAAIQDNTLVESFVWLTKGLDESVRGLESKLIAGKTFSKTAKIHGIQPSYADVAFPQYTSIDRVILKSDFSWSEMLYTAPGSQSMAVQTKYFEGLGLEDDADMLYDCGSSPPQPYFRLRPAAVFESLSGFEETKWRSRQPTLVSWTTLLRISCGKLNTLEDISLKTLLVKPRPRLSPAELERLKFDLQTLLSVAPGSFVLRAADEDMMEIETVSFILGLGFIFVNAVAMVICCFSLITSMYANQFEQAREIATLRALGFTTRGLFRVAFSESICLLLTACLLGVFSGWMVAITQSVQNGYFADLPVQLVAPWQAILTVLLLSFASGVVGAVLVCFKGRREVASILRRVG